MPRPDPYGCPQHMHGSYQSIAQGCICMPPIYYDAFEAGQEQWVELHNLDCPLGASDG